MKLGFGPPASRGQSGKKQASFDQETLSQVSLLTRNEISSSSSSSSSSSGSGRDGGKSPFLLLDDTLTDLLGGDGEEEDEGGMTGTETAEERERRIRKAQRKQLVSLRIET